MQNIIKKAIKKANFKNLNQFLKKGKKNLWFFLKKVSRNLLKT